MFIIYAYSLIRCKNIFGGIIKKWKSFYIKYYDTYYDTFCKQNVKYSNKINQYQLHIDGILNALAPCR